jgi:hypothetical protein
VACGGGDLMTTGKRGRSVRGREDSLYGLVCHENILSPQRVARGALSRRDDSIRDDPAQTIVVLLR